MSALTTQSPPQFPRDFLWGAATAAYQIEGSPLADGAGASIWHRFAHTPGCVRDGDTGDVACDHYRRYPQDVALMRALGLNAYRFSVAWGRVLPEGRGQVNPAGLGFYERLVDTLLGSGIEPMITLYHWDLPAALDDRGGWLNPDVAGWFADYAALLFCRLDDRVKRWVTLNEPWVVVDGGYLHGVHAPGHRNRFEAPLASHNLLRAHGAAVQAYRAHGTHAIGLVVNLEPKYPASSTAADRAATKRADAYMNRQFLDPVLRGEYPPELREIYGAAWREWPQQDHDLIRQPLDFLGINYYTRGVTRDDPSVWPQRASNVRIPGATYSETGWEVCPEGLTDVLRWVRARYGNLPLFITENGAAFDDPPAVAGVIDDRPRVEYLRDHLRAVRAAIAAGVDIRGYFVWSLLDNFEWAQGYSKRFGLVRVDYATQERMPKSSAAFFAQVTATNGAVV
jgi:beta-glucosidase